MGLYHIKFLAIEVFLFVKAKNTSWNQLTLNGNISRLIGIFSWYCGLVLIQKVTVWWKICGVIVLENTVWISLFFMRAWFKVSIIDCNSFCCKVTGFFGWISLSGVFDRMVGDRDRGLDWALLGLDLALTGSWLGLDWAPCPILTRPKVNKTIVFNNYTILFDKRYSKKLPWKILIFKKLISSNGTNFISLYKQFLRMN